MWRSITGFHQDDRYDWVAELACGHRQHVRHDPPLYERVWVLDPTTRASHVGTPLDCLRCDRAELPDTARPTGVGATWNQDSMPPALRRHHSLWRGTWAQIMVERGIVTVRSDTPGAVDFAVGPGQRRSIPPEVPHALDPQPGARFRIAFYAVTGPSRQQVEFTIRGAEIDVGGDPACWRAMVCSVCGRIAARAPGRCACTESRDAPPPEASGS